MAKMYTLVISKKKLVLATDMLRFDSCFEVKVSGEDYVLKTLQFTPRRWESFSTRPAMSQVETITAKQWIDYQVMAGGFLKGLRFAQDMINTEYWEAYRSRLVEGSI